MARWPRVGDCRLTNLLSIGWPIKVKSMSEQGFDWGALGEAWWRENGAACRATETQIKYACSRHQGANKSKAATLAGYSGSPEALRSTGVRAEGSKGVEELMILAAATEGGSADGPVTDREVDLKLTKLIRSPDGAISLKAIEARDKREANRRDRGESSEDDGFSEWRFCRTLLTMKGGASIYMLMVKGLNGDLGWPGNYNLLHDVHHLAMQEPFGKQIWEWASAGCSDDSRKELERRLSDLSYQSEARVQLWGEVGKKPPGPIDLYAGTEKRQYNGGSVEATSATA
jgi:hypothetical protein